MSTTACESRRRDKEVSDEEVSARSVASGAERHRSGAPNMPLRGTVQNCFAEQVKVKSAALQIVVRCSSTRDPGRRLVRRRTVMASVGQIAHLLVLIGVGPDRPRRRVLPRPCHCRTAVRPAGATRRSCGMGAGRWPPRRWARRRSVRPARISAPGAPLFRAGHPAHPAGRRSDNMECARWHSNWRSDALGRHHLCRHLVCLHLARSDVVQHCPR